MPSTRALKGIANGLVETFVSRNNDVFGSDSPLPWRIEVVCQVLPYLAFREFGGSGRCKCEPGTC